MIGFLIRKTFYDLWDNMLKIVILNLGFFLTVLIPVFLPRLFSRFAHSIALEMALSGIGIFVCSIYLAAAAATIKSVSDYGSIDLSSFLKSFKTSWPAGLLMGFFVFLFLLVITIVLPFYLSIDSFVGLGLAAFIFWTMFFALVSFQFFFTVYARLGPNIIKSVKKCLLVFFDNSGFSVFMLFHNFFVLIISVFLAFLFPGPVGVLLYLDEALRLRLLKYDWLEANPGENRRKIPWDALLIEEREKTGSRSFRNFIFPWKD
ncbi:MAG: hypothetical protein LBI12_05915 [Treponema sp.]|jgi:hypothetical protein|nr:hypothetical protein [Treponema sp.]